MVQSFANALLAACHLDRTATEEVANENADSERENENGDPGAFDIDLSEIDTTTLKRALKRVK